MTSSPSIKTLVKAWLVLMTLTFGTIFSGQVGYTEPLGIVMALALLIITGLKATWILHYYLNLKAASTSWNNAFITFLVTLLGLLFLTYIFGLYLRA